MTSRRDGLEAGTGIDRRRDLAGLLAVVALPLLPACGSRTAVSAEETPLCAVTGSVVLASAQAFPAALAVDETSLYWADTWGGTIMKVAKCGGPAATLASHQSYPQALVVDRTNVYWANLLAPSSDASGGEVMAVSKSGGTPITLASGQDGPESVAVDGANVYWVNYGTVGMAIGAVMSVPKAGGEPTTLASQQDGPIAIATDSSSVYFATNSAIMTVSKAGGMPTTVAAGQPAPWAIVVDATTVYWGNRGLGPTINGSIVSMPKGGDTPTTLASGQVAINIATDGTNVYWANLGGVIAPPDGRGYLLGGAVESVPIGGGTPTTLATTIGPAQPSSVAVDSSRVYWANSGNEPDGGSGPNGGTNGSVMMITPK